jgi:hypothetical protein
MAIFIDTTLNTSNKPYLQLTESSSWSNRSFGCYYAVQWTNSYWLLGTTGTSPDETVVVAVSFALA